MDRQEKAKKILTAYPQSVLHHLCSVLDQSGEADLLFYDVDHGRAAGRPR